MDYSVSSLYDVIKNELDVALDFADEKRINIIGAIAFEVDPFECEYEIAFALRDFMEEIGVVLKNFGIKRGLRKHMELSLEIAILFVSDNIREKDHAFINNVKRMRREQGL